MNSSQNSSELEPLSFLYKFIGVRRWKELATALRAQALLPLCPTLGWTALTTCLFISVLPLISVFHDNFRGRHDGIHLPTLTLGTCAVIGLWLRWRFKLPGSTNVTNWKTSIALTHTAFAAGCIPAVFLLALNPELLTERHDLLTSTAASMPIAQKETIFSLIEPFLVVIGLTAWVAVTEEIIFRALLLSVIRRTTILPLQWQKDVLAVVISALLFGAAHYPTWGLAATIALTGLGLGFGAGYIACGEKLIPVVVYHFAFDMLSVFVSLVI